LNLSALHAEFDRWAAMNMAAPIWWRDDDAVADSLALDRLLDLSAKFAVPLTLAVIPKPVEQSLANRIQGNELITVAQHGWSHANHGAAGEKTIELGGLVDEAAFPGRAEHT